MKAVILARVSTEEQKEAGNSLPAQQARLLNYVQRNSALTLDKEFIFDESAVSLAQYYSNAISDNVKRAYEQKLRNGEWIGKAPLGYKNIELENGTKHIIPDPNNYFLIK